MTPVLQFDLDHNLVAEYDSIAEAARSINKGYSCIRDACKKDSYLHTDSCGNIKMKKIRRKF